MQITERGSVLTARNVGSSTAVVRVVPLVETWERPPTDVPREVPEWLDISPVCARVAPLVGFLYARRPSLRISTDCTCGGIS